MFVYQISAYLWSDPTENRLIYCLTDVSANIWVLPIYRQVFAKTANFVGPSRY